jgi:hypothetical protein
VMVATVAVDAMAVVVMVATIVVEAAMAVAVVTVQTVAVDVTNVNYSIFYRQLEIRY